MLFVIATILTILGAAINKPIISAVGFLLLMVSAAKTYLAIRLRRKMSDTRTESQKK
ncbi:MAG: hypothetical protein WCW14_00255 [Candidatus Paceibacterota bacterium]|jgi:uncharacterized membrane protein